MRTVILSFLFTIIILLGNGSVQAQIYLSETNPCDVSAKEIFSVIESVYKLPPISDGVLIVGEVRSGYIRLTKEPLSVVGALARAGGPLKTASFRFYLVRLAKGKENKLELDLRDIKKGVAKDVMLESGDVIFIPRGCNDGKLLPPSKPVYLQQPGGTDDPIRIPSKRIVK